MKSPNGQLVASQPDCDVYLWKAGHPIEIVLPVIAEIVPIEVHVKPDGAEDNSPSFCFILETSHGVCVAAQISLKTLWPAIEAAIKCKGELS